MAFGFYHMHLIDGTVGVGQHIKETRTPLLEKYDFEHERNGVSNLFMLFAPREGWRHVEAIPKLIGVTPSWGNCIPPMQPQLTPGLQRILLYFAGQ
jgi:hypothetical protein